MTTYGFHASHEQIAPSRLLADVQAAEQAGFAMAMCSDHFAPWSVRQGHSGFTWSWLGAALATTSLRLGCVNAPGQRYHPAIVAQAAATLGEMFPGRFWVALGSGQAMNEHITGDRWPTKDTRLRRLEECVHVIRRLHAGEEVTHDGLVTVDRAQLYDRPTEPIPLIAAAISPATAARGARWADGLITINQPLDTLRAVVAAYRDHGGRGPLALQVHLSWAPTHDEALAVARDQWRSNIFAEPLSLDLPTPEHFDIASSDVTDASVTAAVNVSADPERHVAWLTEYAALGFDEIYLHHVGQDQRAWLETAATAVLPALAG
ncbi:TIGR03885 family FMN-dependent LLM class oxidoreductase [Georgenia yuyongxinii]|uniref:TIGR03885 family FMN-dependent LLM class oxidoreductase n=1 Tax=Georgenia yuyongxinii TaxID=2589797 RepID=A0A5B8CDE0_9MICO|nr:TIGR03885 family FMN-dependent LLM class oxidoreductase [Georgenia yuyongxinii]QDC26206.1 TIGR03885 family FMN-dependent LLM class oxidoreductase [Georgenia yuyongxinii]